MQPIKATTIPPKGLDRKPETVWWVDTVNDYNSETEMAICIDTKGKVRKYMLQELVVDMSPFWKTK